MYEYTNAERGVPNEKTAATVSNLKGLFSTFSEEEQYHHTAKQAHIAFGMAIAAAAELGVDATPMEGFDNAKMDEFLGLEKLGLKSVVILPIGYRDENNDWLLNLKKYRTPKEEFITEIN